MGKRRSEVRRSPQLKLSGALCLAFVNTAIADADRRQLGIDDYAGLLVWGQRTGVLTAAAAERLGQQAARAKKKAAMTFKRALALRARLASLFAALLAGQRPAPAELRAFNRFLAAGLPALRLDHGDAGYRWDWVGDEVDLERVLWPVAHSAAELLMGHERALVARCPGCGLWFVNRSTRRRIWCETKVCGNRSKALRYYHRRGKDAPRGPSMAVERRRQARLVRLAESVRDSLRRQGDSGGKPPED